MISSGAKQAGSTAGRKSKNRRPVAHPLDEHLESYAFGRLPPDQVGLLEFHISECAICKAKVAEATRLASEAIQPNSAQQNGPARVERRSALRIPTDDPASLKALNPLSQSRLDIRIVDTSKHGFKVRVPEYVEPGTIVQIRLRNQIALAEVRYCLSVGTEFHIGVEIQDVFPSS